MAYVYIRCSVCATIFSTGGKQGLIQGGVDWVASHPPWVCILHNIFVWALSDLLEQTILVNQVFDEMQINHSDKEYLEQENQTA